MLAIRGAAVGRGIDCLCNHPVARPREVEQFIRYFCGDASDPIALGETEPLRISFYKAVATFVRAYAAISNHLVEAGYTLAEAEAISKEVQFFSDIRAAIKHYSGEELDIKPFEADMRHLINTYIRAESADPLGELDQYSLVELIIQTGIHDAIARKLNERGNLSRNSVAEGIINNIRQTIIRDQLTDPRFYEEMSKLLDDLILQKHEETEDYKEFLRNAEKLVQTMAKGQTTSDVPAQLQGNTEAILIYKNLPRILSQLDQDPDGIHMAADEGDVFGDPYIPIALDIDRAMREQAPAGWRGDDAREKQVLNALYPIMSRNRAATKALFEFLKGLNIYR